MVSTDTETKSRKFMLKFLQRIFKVDSHSELDRWIASKHPQTAGDIDHLMRQWGHKSQGTWL